jgi:hypothetical protein
MFNRTRPDPVRAFTDARTRLADDPSALESFYGALPSCDFGRSVLQRVPESLRLLPVAHCGWIDPGTPERLRAFGSTRRPGSGRAIDA